MKWWKKILKIEGCSYDWLARDWEEKTAWGETEREDESSWSIL